MASLVLYDSWRSFRNWMIGFKYKDHRFMEERVKEWIVKMQMISIEYNLGKDLVLEAQE